MRMILPSAGDELDVLGLAEAYAYPRERWLRANFVTSADGGGLRRRAGPAGCPRPTTSGSSASCASWPTWSWSAREPRAPRSTSPRAAARPSRRCAQAARTTPAIALVTRTLGLNLASPLFTEAPPDARTIVITCAASDADLRAATAKVADVIVAGDETVDLAAALDALADRGLRRVLCEGGPHLLGDLAAAGLLDELCLSLSPTLAGPGASRIIAGPPSRRSPADARATSWPETTASCSSATSRTDKTSNQHSERVRGSR